MGGGGEWTGRKRKGSPGRGSLRKKRFLPIFGFGVRLLAANWGREPFLFSLQAERSLNCPSLLLFRGGNNHVRRPVQLVLRAAGSQPRWRTARTRGRKNKPACAPGRLPERARDGLASSVSDQEREGASCPCFICRGRAGHTTQATLTARPVWFGGKPVGRDGWKVTTLEEARGTTCLFTGLAVVRRQSLV